MDINAIQQAMSDYMQATPAGSPWGPEVTKGDTLFSGGESSRAQNLNLNAYWLDPRNIAVHYNATQLAPDQDWASLGINTDFLELSYNFLKRENQNKEWSEWTLPEDNSFVALLAQTPAPAVEAQWANKDSVINYESVLGDLYGVLTPETVVKPALPQVDIIDWATRPGWQKTAALLTSNPTIMGAAGVAVPAAIVGILGVLGGGALAPALLTVGGITAAGGLAGWLATEESGEKLQDIFGEKMGAFLSEMGENALEVMNRPAEVIEAGLGTLLQIGDLVINHDADFAAVRDSIPAAYQSGKMFYESVLGSNIGTGFINAAFVTTEKISDFLTGKDQDADYAPWGYIWTLDSAEPIRIPITGLAYIENLRSQILRNPTKTGQLIEQASAQFGLSGVFADFIGQSLLDPWNLWTPAGRTAMATYGKWANDPIMVRASNMSKKFHGGALRTAELYQAAARVESLTREGTVYQPTKFQQYWGNLTPEGKIKQTGTGGGLLGKVWKYWEKLNDLDVESQAKMMGGWMLDMVHDAGAWAHGDRVLFKRWLNSLREGSFIGAPALAELWDTPIFRTSHTMFQDFAWKKLDVLEANLDYGLAQKLVFRRAADVLKIDIDKVVRDFSKNDPAMVNKIRDLIDTDNTIFDVPYEQLQKLGKFFKENPWTLSVEHWQAEVMSSLSDYMAEELPRLYGIKEAPKIDRIMAAAKGMQSLVLLAFSPSYLLNNMSTDMMTRIFDGIGGWTSLKEVNAYFDRIQSMPSRLREGIGSMAYEDMGGKAIETELGKLKRAITNAKKGTDYSQKLVDASNSVSRAVGIFTKLAAAWESADSMRATYSAHKKAYPFLLGEFLSELSGADQAVLRSNGHDPALIRDTLLTMLNGNEVDRYFAGEMFQNPDKFYASIAKRTTQGVADLLRESGIFDTIKQRLDRGETFENAVSGVRSDLINRLGDKLESDALLRSQMVASSVKNDLAEIGHFLYSLMDSEARLQVSHTVEMQTMHEAAGRLPWDQGWEYVQSGYARARKYFAYDHEWRKSTWLGILYGIDADPNAVRSFGVELDNIDRRYKAYYAKSDELWNAFHKRWKKKKSRNTPEFWADHAKIQNELWADYAQATVHEFMATEKAGVFFVDSVVKTLGEKARKAAEDFWDEMSGANEYLRQQTSSFRAAMMDTLSEDITIPAVQKLVEGIEPREVKQLFPVFYEEILIPAQVESLQVKQEAALRFMEALELRPPVKDLAKPNAYYAELLAKRRADIDRAFGSEPPSPPPPEEPPTPGTPPPEPGTPPPEPGTPSPAPRPTRPAPPEPVTGKDIVIPPDPYSDSHNTVAVGVKGKHISNGQVFREQLLMTLTQIMPESDRLLDIVDAAYRTTEAAAHAWASVDPTVRSSSMWYSRFREIRYGSAIDFDRANAKRVAGGLPPYRYGSLLGTIELNAQRKPGTLRLYGGANEITPIHEIIHTFMYDMSREDARTWLEYVGKKYKDQNALIAAKRVMKTNDPLPALIEFGRPEDFVAHGVKWMDPDIAGQATGELGGLVGSFYTWATELFATPVDPTATSTRQQMLYKWDNYTKLKKVPPEIAGIFDRMLLGRMQDVIYSWEGKARNLAGLTKAQLQRYGWLDTPQKLLELINNDNKILGSMDRSGKPLIYATTADVPLYRVKQAIEIRIKPPDRRYMAEANKAVWGKKFDTLLKKQFKFAESGGTGKRTHAIDGEATINGVKYRVNVTWREHGKAFTGFIDIGDVRRALDTSKLSYNTTSLNIALTRALTALTENVPDIKKQFKIDPVEVLYKANELHGADLREWRPPDTFRNSVSYEDMVKMAESGEGLGDNNILNYVRQASVPGQTEILDFGAGKNAPHAHILQGEGYNVKAYDLAPNIDPLDDIFKEGYALADQYDVVYANGVLNVQTSIPVLENTIGEIMDATRAGGKAILSFPRKPRYDAWAGIHGDSAIATVMDALKPYGEVFMHGDRDAPIFEVIKSRNFEDTIMAFESPAEISLYRQTLDLMKEYITEWMPDEISPYMFRQELEARIGPSSYALSGMRDLVSGWDSYMPLNKAQYLELVDDLMSGAYTSTPSPAYRLGTYHDAFRRWFRESRIVNPDGTPMILYHGTAPGSEFSVYRVLGIDAQGKVTGDWGAHFGSVAQANEAAFYKRNAGGNAPYIMPVYLRIENPFVIDFDPGVWHTIGLQDVFTLYQDTPAAKANPHFKLIQQDLVALTKEGLLNHATSPNDLQAWLAQNQGKVFEKYGYDGIQYRNRAEGAVRVGKTDWSYVVWDPTQIKSALANNGNYDFRNPDIVADASGVPYPGMSDNNGLGSHIYQYELESDAYHAYITHGLDEYLKLAGLESGTGFAGVENIDPASLKILNKYKAQAKNAVARATSSANAIAEKVRDWSLLNYDKRYNFDRVLTFYSPYQFWYTRTMVEWAVRFADRPGILASFSRLAKVMSTYQDEDRFNFPTRLKGRLRIPFAAVPDWATGDVFVNPLKKLFPFYEMLSPYERVLKEEHNIETEAEGYIWDMFKEGTITEEQRDQALTREGTLWNQVLARANANERGDVIDYMSLFLSPALYLSIPGKLLMNKGDEIGPFPMSRTLQALSSATGIPGISRLDIESAMKRSVGMSQYGGYGDFYVDRQLSFMVQEGMISSDAAIQAMIDRTGADYEEAVRRTGLELSYRVQGSSIVSALKGFATGKSGASEMLKAILFSWMPADVLSKAELEQRGLQREFQLALQSRDYGNPNAITEFFDKYPEMESRLAIWQEPDQRLTRFLSNTIKDRFFNLTTFEKNQISDQFGPKFSDYISGDDENVSLDQIVAWAQAIGTPVPEYLQGIEPASLEMPQGNINEAVTLYYQMRDELFPGLSTAMQYVYTLPENQRNSVWNQLPMAEYKQWQKDYFKAFPDIEPYVTKTDEQKAKADAILTYAEKYPAFADALSGYILGREPTSGELRFMQYIWEQMGKPEKTFNDWLESIQP